MQRPTMDKPAATDRPPQMRAKRVRRWTMRVVAVGLVCLGFLWLIQTLLLPVIVNQQFAKSLDHLGFVHPTFRVMHASITGAEVADIKAGENNAIQINRITVTYSPFKVLAGHLDTIIIAGAEIKLALGDGQSKLISPHGSKSSDSVPFDRVEVRSTTLKVDWQDRHFWLPVDGSLDVQENNDLKLSAHTFFRGVDVPITGQLTNGFKDFNLRAQADDITVAGLLSALPQRWTRSIPAISGSLNLDATVHKSADDYALDLLAAGPDAQMHLGSTAFRGPSVQLHLAASTDSNTFTLIAKENSSICIASIDLSDSHSSPVTFAIAPGPILSRNTSDGAIHLNAKLQTTNSVSLSLGSFALSAQGIGIQATMINSAIDGAVTLSNASATDADAKLELTGISGAIPFAFHTKPTIPAMLTTSAVTLDGTPLPPPSASIKFIDGVLDAKMIWEPIEGAQLTTTANFSRDLKNGWHGQIATTAPHFVISDPVAWRKIVKSKGDFDITGAFNLDAKAEFVNGQMRPRVRLQAENAIISSKQYDFAIEGVSADLTLWRLWPIATTGSQVIKAKSFRFGKMNLTDGLIQLRINDPHSILVEKTTWSWAGGHLESYAIQLDPAKPVADLTLYADNLNVGQILRFNFPDKNMSGQGNLYGKLPLSIHWPMIQFGNGFLYSAPGDGELSLGAEANTVADLVAGQNPSNEVKAQFRDQLIQSLKNFRYDLVKADFVHQPDGGMNASIHFKGKGQTNNAPLDITFNINGIDVIFRNVLVVKKFIESIGGK